MRETPPSNRGSAVAACDAGSAEGEETGRLAGDRVMPTGAAAWAGRDESGGSAAGAAWQATPRAATTTIATRRAGVVIWSRS